MNRGSGFALLAGALLATACSQGLLLEGRIRGLSATVAEVERSGALSCAPRELAIAKSQLEFAQIDLDQGQLSNAEAHLAKGEPNVRAAAAMSPANRCAPRGPAEKPPPDTDGDGVDDARDQCVLEPEDKDGYLDDDGCPDLDNDADGIPDENDQCKNEPEDIDGYQDTDGCPDPDNDGDGIPDTEDFCPNTPGIASGDKPGCPKRTLVVVTDKEIRINQQIQFEFNKSVVKPGISDRILDDIVGVLNDNPRISLEVQGHTDNVGADSYNVQLSQSRAEAVRAYLVAHGVAPLRLSAKGYGSRQPLVPNSDEANRALNRRVQFIRTESRPLSPPP
jgi:OOP family OmpA-OmpF porin